MLERRQDLCIYPFPSAWITDMGQQSSSLCRCWRCRCRFSGSCSQFSSYRAFIQPWGILLNFFTEFTSSKHKIFQVFKVDSSISHRLLMLAQLIALCMTLKVENSFGLWRKKCIQYVQWSSQCFILGSLTCSLTKLPKLGCMNLCWCHPSETWNHFLEFFSPY